MRRPGTFTTSAVGSVLSRRARPPGAATDRRNARLGSAGERPPLGLRWRVALRRDALDRALAGGAEPTASAELALRAARLVRARNCRGLARAVRLAVWEAEAGVSALRVSARPVRRGEVLSAREALVSLAEQLESARPHSPEGVAIAQRLFTELRSPLFEWAEPGTVRRLARLAVAAMDPPLPR
jgi:hypothetical protein